MKSFGGKADSLLKLKNNKFNVPNFFILDSNDYFEFLKYNNLIDTIKTLYSEKNYDEIKTTILNAKMSKTLEQKIKNNFFNLNSKTVSVRSSATNEDGINQSFAGQYSSFLNVNIDNLFQSIKKCWCSLYNLSVLNYKKDENLYGMNVIVQKMVSSEYSGVAFSIDPTSDTKNYTVIEVVKGLGESLVSGKTTPSKYLVRRQTFSCDLQLGDVSLSDFVISQLEQTILNIEKLYGLPVDIEFGIENNEIYILQARPISTFTVNEKPFMLSITRPYSILEQEIYFKGEYEGIKYLTDGLYYFKPLFIYDSENKTSGVYYNMSDLEEDPRLMYRYFSIHFDDFEKKLKQVNKKISYIKNIISNNLDFDIDEFINALIFIYPFISLGQIAGHFEEIEPRIKDIFVDFRNNYDNLIYQSCNYLFENFNKKIPADIKKYMPVLTINELSNKTFPSISTLEGRLSGYIYFGKLYEYKNYDKILKDNKIKIVTDEQNEDNILKGQIAFSGNAEGKVCKIYNENDFHKFNKGDILVTPMTVPRFCTNYKTSKRNCNR